MSTSEWTHNQTCSITNNWVLALKRNGIMTHDIKWMSLFKKLFYIFYIIFVQGDTLWYLPMYLQYIVIRFTPAIIIPLLSSQPCFPEQFQQFSFLYFHIRIQNAFIMFILLPPLLVLTHFPLVPTHRKDLFFFLIVQRGFTLVLQTCMYHALIKLTPH
jgi:hypothetical protein